MISVQKHNGTSHDWFIHYNGNSIADVYVQAFVDLHEDLDSLFLIEFWKD